MKERDHLGELDVDGKVVVVKPCHLGPYNSGYFRYISVNELMTADASEHSCPAVGRFHCLVTFGSRVSCNRKHARGTGKGEQCALYCMSAG